MGHRNFTPSVFAWNGDALGTPESTIESLWAALGAGAQGLLLNCTITSDDVVVSTPTDKVQSVEKSDEQIPVRELTLASLQALDAGAEYRSTVLDENGQPTGERGADHPWISFQKDKDDKKNPLKNRQAVQFNRMDYLLQNFARRTPVLLLLDPAVTTGTPLLEKLLAEITRMALSSRVTLLSTEELIGDLAAEPDNESRRLCLDARATAPVDQALLEKAISLGAESICVNHTAIAELSVDGLRELMKASAEANIGWHVAIAEGLYAPPESLLPQLRIMGVQLASVLTRGVIPCKDVLQPPGIVLAEDFAGDTFDTRQWRAGYSSLNKVASRVYPDCKIEQKDGLYITLKEGFRYSGAAAATVVPLYGDFDATVDFHVSSPAQATTLELAAIGIDPGYHNINPHDKELNSRSVNLTFDVHGSPPYASSERDQNDAFRSGWNNSYNVTQVSPDFEARSVNMYNKYTRGVGDGGVENLDGSLRLLRCGPVFCSYYKDKHNRYWVGSGSMLVQSMPDDCFIRLALKHWGKNGCPPANEVIFTNFVVKQR